MTPKIQSTVTTDQPSFNTWAKSIYRSAKPRYNCKYFVYVYANTGEFIRFIGFRSKIVCKAFQVWASENDNQNQYSLKIK